MNVFKESTVNITHADALVTNIHGAPASIILIIKTSHTHTSFHRNYGRYKRACLTPEDLGLYGLMRGLLSMKLQLKTSNFLLRTPPNNPSSQLEETLKLKLAGVVFGYVKITV